jgi:glucans biosynthesis protein
VSDPRALTTTRRVFGSLAASALWAWNAAPGHAQTGDLHEPQPFSFERLIERARMEAEAPFVPPPDLPPAISQLTYEDLVRIRFRPERAIWAGSDGYRLQFVHLGAYLRAPVRVFTVQDGVAQEVLYDPAMFDFGGVELEPQPPESGFAGLRVHYPLDGPDDPEPLLVFLGASYFRARARGARYGLAARGLALETGLGRPEEFPRFSSFWIERAETPADPLTINALLESPSVVGAYRFVVSVRDATLMDTDASLFFRSDVQQVGIAPLTSMYYFGTNDRAGVDDWRPAVHDSAVLSAWRGSGELLARPLVNPSELRLSVFADDNPRGFGLLQRDRDFHAYRDLAARYELRPNLWVQPKGQWGAGSIRLIEIPTPDETNDNIVAFWTPEAPVSAGRELRTAYTLRWSLDEPISTGLAPVRGTFIGAGGGPQADGRDSAVRRVVIDFGPFDVEGVPADVWPELVIECNNGTCASAVLERNELTGGWRAVLDVRPEGSDAVELRSLLTYAGRSVSETWLYRLDRS